MPKALAKPFIEWAGYSYDEWQLSENFLVVESDKQITAYLRSKSPDEFKTWLQEIRTASKNTDPINSILTYQYFTEGMDKPYNHNMTPMLVKALATEKKTNYKENLYHLLSNYDRRSVMKCCKEIYALKDSALEPEFKAKFLALCPAQGGKKTMRRGRKNRKTRRRL